MSYLNPEVAGRFWIMGHMEASAPDMVAHDTIVILTDGAHTIVARVAASSCSTHGFYFCDIEGVRFSDIPANRSPITGTVAAVNTPK